MLRRLATPFIEFGPLAGALYLVERALQRLSPELRLYCYELMVQPISDEPLLPARWAQQIEIREIKRGDPEIALMPARPEIKESRFAQSAICLGAFRKRELIGYIWFCFKTYEEDEARCTFVLKPEDQAVFDFDLHVFPEHRMGLGFLGVWHGASKVLRSRGINFSYSRLTRFNLASRRAHARLGWKRVGSALFLRAWRIEVMAATIFPYVSLSLGESQRVRLELRPDVLLA
jgi:hypothetical protein